ncbi:ABC transporter ATP-binding protein [Brachybacterium vulturis]|uniref:ABC transporter ATP-binding protein n=1 Tax=Brachybacterium vulturis TaxID=2017484 RepID=A0A291GS24_9MICO|nr:ABC transporter ATP-binding protein [Brachybacterium vulturis]ATG53008.1 ABC transporter ATP-binding protein [Brachybacterium vulturis]
MTIRLDDVSFAYPDGSLAVDRVNLAVAAGERVAIIGQNGAGKTTTVKLMNGLLRPTTGRVLVDDVDTASQTTATTARQVAYVFQNPDDQIFGTDVRSELEYIPRHDRWSAERTNERVRRAVKMTGIGKYLDLNPNDLPFAIKKFVAIAAMLVGEPRYVILDEPTAGLDGRGLALLKRLIGQLEDEGTAVVTITHDMRFVADTFDRVVVMAQRQVIADAPATEIFDDDDVLARARLQRPVGAQLAQDLGLAPASLQLDDVVALIP